MNTISGLTFYDALNKLSIGALTLASLYQWPVDASRLTPILDAMPNEVFWMYFLFLSFLVGLVIQTIIEFFTIKLRNHPFLLRKTCKKRYKLYCLVKASKSKDDSSLKKHDCFCPLAQCNDNVSLGTSCKEGCESLCPCNDAQIRRLYYTAYYNVQKNNLLGNIPTLEALERFTRSLILLLPFLALTCCVNNVLETVLLPLSPCGKMRIIAIIWFSLFGVEYFLLNKIPTLVWEADYFIKVLKQEEHQIPTLNNQKI